MKGFRQQPLGSRKERLRSMETELKNSQMAQNISQMMLKQMMQNIQSMSQDLGRAMGLINELQYKIIAVQKVAKLDTAELNAIAADMRLNDFIEASDKEDKEGNFTIGTVIDENSTVILTSTTAANPDGGIFRSRIKLTECGVPDLIKAFMGKGVGEKAIVKLNGTDHEIEILAIRQPPIAEPVPQPEEKKETQTIEIIPQSAADAGGEMKVVSPV